MRTSSSRTAAPAVRTSENSKPPARTTSDSPSSRNSPPTGPVPCTPRRRRTRCANSPTAS